MAAGFAGVLVHGAAVGRRFHHDFVVGVDAESRHAGQAAEPAAVFCADFVGLVAGRLQAEIEAAALIAVGKLVHGGGFKAARIRGVAQQALGGLPRKRGAGQPFAVVGLAAVVGIGGGDVVVARFEMHVAVAQAAIEPPLRCELPAGLHIGVEIPNIVGFVAPQFTLRAECIADEIFIAAALFRERVKAQARAGAQRFVGKQVLPAPAHIRAVIAAAQINHTAGVARVVLLHSFRYRLKLQRFALAAVKHGFDAVVRIQSLLIHQAALHLLLLFAHIISNGRWRCLARILLPLCAREALRIVGAGVDAVGNQLERGAVIQLPFHIGIGHVFKCAAVVAIAFGLEARQAQHIGGHARAVAAARGFEAVLVSAVAAGIGVGFNRGRVLPLFALHQHHAAGSIAIKRRHGAVEHFDAPRRA